MSFAKSALLVAALAGLAARADITPTAPWGGVVDNTGGPCEIQWNIDTTSEWKDVSIYLMTGSNQNFVQLAEVATGIDGTTGDGKYSWTCPEVTINAPIYFYAFSNNGAAVSTWTTRFTIASASGQTVPAPQATQPDGSATPWGTGAIVGGSSGGGSGAVTSGVSSGATSRTSSGAAGGGSSGPVSSAQTTNSAPVTTSSTSSSSSDDSTNDGTTVITVQPTTTSRMQTTTRSTVSSGINGNAQNSSSNSTSNTGAASSTHGSVAGIGLLLAVLAGLWVV